MNRQERIVAVTATLALTPFAFAGCAAPASGFEQAVPPAVVASDPNIVDAYVSTSTSLGGSGFWVRVYLDDTSDEAVADAVGAALESAYRAAPSQPTHITLDVAAGPRPDDVQLNRGSLPLDDEVVAQLGLEGRVADDSIRLSADELSQRFGPWGVEG